MKLSPLKRFMLHALAWLPFCFFVWWWASGLMVAVPIAVAGKMLTWGWPDLVTEVTRVFDEQGKPVLDALTSVVLMQRGPDGLTHPGYLIASAYPMMYGYSLPLFFGLVLATPQEEERRWFQYIVGALVIWLAQAFGLASSVLKQLIFQFGPEATAAAHAAGLNDTLVAVCYQFGYLILPTVVPAALWLGFNRSFLESLIGRKFGEPMPGDAGRNPAP